MTVAAPVTEMLLPYFAQSEGLFKKYGINVTFKTGLNATTILGAWSSGELDFTSIEAPQPEIANLKNIDVRWLAVWADKPDVQMCAGPGISSISQLAGKSVGVSGTGATTAVLTHLALQDAGVSSSSVKLVPIPSVPNQAQSFIAGEIDAFACGPPLTQTVLQKRQGSSVIYKFQDHTLWDGGGLVGYMPYVTKHPGTTTKVLEALNDAAKLWTTSPSQAEAVIEKEANSTPTQAQESYQASLAVWSKSLVPTTAIESQVLSAIDYVVPGASSAATSKFIAPSPMESVAK